MDEQHEFEIEVQRVSRALFTPHDLSQGATMVGRVEHDGVFIGPDIAVAVESTVSGKLDKAKHDGRKLEQLCRQLARDHPFKAIKGYFVTRSEPTAQQRDFIKKLDAPVIALSFGQLCAQLVDGRGYLDARQNYPFGSARNPKTRSTTELDPYVEIPYLGTTPSGQRQFSIQGIASEVGGGGRIILVGDFGAGKSTAMREIHLRLTKAYKLSDSSRIPVTLNLRDHQGQRDPVEVLHRHSSRVGFPDAAGLIRAWRAGYVHLLLDGYDEIATAAWRGSTADLRRIRYQAVELIRRFVADTPLTSGIVVSGRKHFFDNPQEMKEALGLTRGLSATLYTDEFSEDQIATYLKSHGWTGTDLPAWLPSRPLLVGYLATSGLLPGLADAKLDAVLGPAEGWDLILDELSAREAAIEAGVPGVTIRRLLERLATHARRTPEGDGPLFPEDLSSAFTLVVGAPPDDESQVILQRMPGLGAIDSSDGSRYLIDADLADVARSGDLVEYVATGGAMSILDTIQGEAITQGELGIGVNALQAARRGHTAHQWVSAAEKLSRRGGADAIVLDMLRTALALDEEATIPPLVVTGVALKHLVIGDGASGLEKLVFDSCLVARLDLTEYDGQFPLPAFERCMFEEVLGVADANALPKQRFVDCIFDSFDPSTRTTKGIMAMTALSTHQRIALSVIKKVYSQPGSGRRENALTRGIDPALRAHVAPVVAHLCQQGLLLKSKAGNQVVYCPTRGMMARVRKMLEAGQSSLDPAFTLLA